MIASQLPTTLPNRASNRLRSALLAIEQGDLLGIFTHAHEIEAEVRLIALLLEIERDQRAGRPNE